MEISVIGGDLRLIRLVQMYAKENNKIYTYGLEKYFKDDGNKIDNNIIMCQNMEEIISLSKYIISSIPLSKDNIYINSPYSNEKIEINDLKNKIFELLCSEDMDSKYFIAGKIPKDFYTEKIKCIDLLENEEFNILNSIPTVEGTIKIVLEEREETIHESNVLICGFGRIGKILCDRFKSLGAHVFCTARKESDLAWIREEGYIPLEYSGIKGYGGIFDILINTVPSLVIDKEKIDSFDKNILLIDLASNPGGIDKEYALNKKIKVITALGIPTKEMPTAAARYIKEVIEKLMKKN